MRGDEVEGEMHWAALVGKDGGVVESGLDVHIDLGLMLRSRIPRSGNSADFDVDVFIELIEAVLEAGKRTRVANESGNKSRDNHGADRKTRTGSENLVVSSCAMLGLAHTRGNASPRHRRGWHEGAFFRDKQKLALPFVALPRACARARMADDCR